MAYEVMEGMDAPDIDDWQPRNCPIEPRERNRSKNRDQTLNTKKKLMLPRCCGLLPPPFSSMLYQTKTEQTSEKSVFFVKIIGRKEEIRAEKARISWILAGAEGFEPSARGFGVAVEKAWLDITREAFRTVGPSIFRKTRSRRLVMLF